MSLIEISNLSKVYAAGGSTVRAVDDVSLTVEKGDFLSIVGHSGSGKTTLISLIGGIIRPSSGKVIFDGGDVGSFDDERLSEYRNCRIGFMFQFASLLPILTARENVLLPYLFSPNGRTRGRKDAEGLLGLVGLGDKFDARPAQLSGGQQRRVAIARALMNDPQLILADEPTGDLDEETEAEIMEIFNRLNSERKVTFILITHNLDLAKQASRRLRMSRGRLTDL